MRSVRSARRLMVQMERLAVPVDSAGRGDQRPDRRMGKVRIESEVSPADNPYDTIISGVRRNPTMRRRLGLVGSLRSPRSRSSQRLR